jgi:hypothetical protein
METLNLYDKDFYAWTQEQAKFIKEKAFAKLDLIHLFDEVESMGKHEQRELTSRLEILLMHLLKWKYQPNYANKNSWKYTIKEQRKKLNSHLKENPSLKNPETFNERFLDAYDTAILRAVEETGLDENVFSKDCPFTEEQVFDNEFYPN